ncbi:hypothetical protein NOX26_06555 [Enterobacter kobei]|nr:hypothetical protein [Enterobacter kobei]MCQ4413359.1 hypothetical protein [Enterobacter kobei]HDC4302438.1 hypothetical protein [Enterobacter kobei]
MDALTVWSMQQGQQTQQATDLGDALYRVIKSNELVDDPNVQSTVNELKLRSVSICQQLSDFAVQHGLVK